MMSSSCNYFFFWFCLTEEFDVVWVLRVADVPISGTVLASWYCAAAIGIPLMGWFSYCGGESAPNVTVFLVNKFDWIEFAVPWEVISSTSMRWGRVVVKYDIALDVRW